MDIARYRTRFAGSKSQAQKRNILWLLTFDEYMQVWAESGHTIREPKLHLLRYMDEGAYQLGNVRIGLAADNCAETTALYWLKRGRYGPIASYIMRLPSQVIRDAYLAKCMNLGV